MRIILTCLLLFLVQTGYSQSVPKVDSITKGMKLPTRKETGKKELLGKYTFVVELDGSLTNIQVKDSLGYGIDEEIVKRLSETKFEVAKVAGKPTRIAYSLPILLKLDKK